MHGQCVLLWGVTRRKRYLTGQKLRGMRRSYFFLLISHNSVGESRWPEIKFFDRLDSHFLVSIYCTGYAATFKNVYSSVMLEVAVRMYSCTNTWVSRDNDNESRV